MEPEKIDCDAIEKPSRAVREYLDALDGAEEPDEARKTPKVISPSDPASAWTAKANKRVQFGYGLNYLIDNEHAIIVDVEPTPARTFDEVRATGSMLERTKTRFGLKPKRLAADTAYGTGKFLNWLVQREIAPHIPVWDKGTREDGTFSRTDFIFHPEQDQCTCPAGKHSSNTAETSRFRARTMLMMASVSTAPANATAIPANSRRAAARTCRRAMSCVASMKKRTSAGRHTAVRAIPE